MKAVKIECTDVKQVQEVLYAVRKFSKIYIRTCICLLLFRDTETPFEIIHSSRNCLFYKPALAREAH